MADIPTIHIIDKDHDCEVRLDDQSSYHIFKVARAILRQSSPIFAKSIDQDSAWPKIYDAQNILQLTFRDDDPEALDFLFRLIHFQPHAIPRNLSLKRLFNLAQICDKYSCIDIARPFIREYTTNFKEAEDDTFWNGFYHYCGFLQPKDEPKFSNQGIESDDLYGDNKPAIAKMLLYLSYVFDLENIFPKAYRAYLMIWQPKRNADDADDNVEGPTCLPDRLYNHFMAEWEESRNGVVKAVEALLHKYTFGLVYGIGSRCTVSHMCTICDISLYGSFIRRLHYKGIFPIREKSDALSLYELRSRIEDLQIGRYTGEGLEGRLPHNKCTISFMNLLLNKVNKSVELKSVKLTEFKNNMVVKRKLQVLDEDGGRDDGEPGTATVSGEDDQDGEEVYEYDSEEDDYDAYGYY
ncbi:hypothetical protein H072_3649 [Dactylellina haptotyla CBS 200.50]|uniref:BTB domain-containing protein n=1 Tax=Dactylellina haptotyla (strain CBS 200.50) TaxID=1284197 RepID=S8AHD8_DACHA|nr:hypothetical protein H072_3649 [Dactylellina haptotyla CBS 200.50]